MSDVKTLYKEDFVAWSKEQAEALRSAARGSSNQKLDWENLAEEIASLGASERRELHSQVQRIIHHLLKLEYSTATEARRGWIETIDDARSVIELVLEASPSLGPHLAAAIAAEMGRGARKAIRDLDRYNELGPATVTRLRASTYTLEQIFGDWFPPGSRAAAAERRIAMITSGATAGRRRLIYPAWRLVSGAL